MNVSKTKTKIVEVARQLFANNGIAETTMNDIAKASGKGRRTLYTYFRSKEEVYLACVSSELKIIGESFSSVLKMDVAPDEKIKKLVEVHLSTYKNAVIRNGNLHGQFFRNILEVEKVRKKLDRKEIVMIAGIIRDGNKEGLFNVKDERRTALVILQSLKGLEVPYIRDTVFFKKDGDSSLFLFDFLFYGLSGDRS